MLVAGPACGHGAIRDPRASGDAWTIDVLELLDGPDSVAMSEWRRAHYTADDGERLFRVRVRVRNDAATSRSFNFDRCDLDDGGAKVAASLVATGPVMFEADRVLTLGRGESADRTLVFSYPLDRSPTRLSCAPMIIRLPPIAARKSTAGGR